MTNSSISTSSSSPVRRIWLLHLPVPQPFVSLPAAGATMNLHHVLREPSSGEGEIRGGSSV
ncbi:hypothetical protein E2562_038690 [Oryza meyeriana var. granulata]|uniref:Uncharacterized protein n=1 Tax=Oryza meyeriana var. granulata TaxID=110450 RepID=A0A6G1E973_9ORYZ|nr:hypothetical protein E2562_038690 [Oryza meyeriana var. granulata]